MFGEEWTARTIAAVVIGITILGIGIFGILQGLDSIKEHRADADIRRITSTLEAVDHKPGTVVRLNFVPEYAVELSEDSLVLRRDSIAPRERVLRLQSDISTGSVDGVQHICIRNDGSQVAMSQNCDLPVSGSVQSDTVPPTSDEGGAADDSTTDDGTTDDGTDEGTDDTTSTSGSDWWPEHDDSLEPTNMFTVYFVPGSSSYGGQEFQQRSERYFESLLETTPLGECGMAEMETFEQTSPPNREYDLLVNVTDQDTCNAYRALYSNGESIITIHRGVDDAYGDTVLPHEFGHEFQLCDLYLRSEWEDQNDNDYTGGCANALPEEWGWYPAPSYTANPDENTCRRIEADDSTTSAREPQGFCGEDLDQNTDTHEGSIMGGLGGAGDFDVAPDGSVQGCSGDTYIDQPAFTREAYDHMEQQLADRGFECVPQNN